MPLVERHRGAARHVRASDAGCRSVGVSVDRAISNGAGDASGIPVGGASEHGPECACRRCRGFEPGHELSVRHGAYAVVGLEGRAREVADSLEELMRDEGVWRDVFAPTIRAAAVVLVRLERAEAALQQVDEAAGENPLASYVGENRDTLARLRQDARGWANTARTYLNDLGLSPASLARIARDTGVGKAARASAAIRALDEHVQREYGAGRPDS